MTNQRTLIRIAGAAVAAFGAVVGLTGQAQAVSYELSWFRTANSSQGALAEGALLYPSSGCGYTKIKDPDNPYMNSVSDTDADGNGAIAYIGYIPCNSTTGHIVEKKLASVAGEGNSAELPTTTYYNVRWAAVRVCEYRGTNQHIDCGGWAN
ncbi:hypothetical protein GCM10011579_032570 [Streptomyces albiflavescens]|uniref:Uncharacterized protein n=1 Tax=Streptomyces albiflavescens TaxID=1623582 RepID=A0A918D3Y6_9ACTN|nr:hypothetical protein [Streptomyces albiflavescens]GGN63824.1 hypothetical protein GCM10011579_032570 [Streptomyces albiflavescens]